MKGKLHAVSQRLALRAAVLSAGQSVKRRLPQERQPSALRPTLLMLAQLWFLLGIARRTGSWSRRASRVSCAAVCQPQKQLCI